MANTSSTSANHVGTVHVSSPCGSTDASPADVATVDPMLLIDFLTALRLCTNLRSFTWTFSHDAPASRAERVLMEYLAVLRRLRVPRLDVRGVKGALGAQVLTRLMYMDDIASIGVQTHGSDVVRAESMAAALRERLRHLEFSGRDTGSRSYVSRKFPLPICLTRIH